jgi:uncharacterized protein (DUF2141 family)
MNMQSVRFLAMLIAIVWGGAAYTQSASASSALRVSVEGVRNNSGQVGILLFSQAKGFPSDHSAAIRQEMLPARKGKVEAIFENLLPGTYAIAVMHDENKNQKIDTNMLGIPKEGYGVSNNVKNLLRAPRFEEAAFQLRSAPAEQKISLIY